jgi:hypothetical protein
MDVAGRTGEMKNAYKIFVGKSEGKRLLGRSTYRWKDNVKMNVEEIGWKGVVWIHLDWIGTNGELL